MPPPALSDVVGSLLRRSSSPTDIAQLCGELDVVNSFGADPSGLIDSTALINSADALATVIGKNLYFPAGTYLINQSTRLTMNGCSWRGAGRSASILKSAAGTYPLATNMVTCANRSNLTISDLGFDMSLVTFTTGTTSRHLLMFHCTNWAVRNCSFTGIQAFNLALYANGGGDWEIIDCYFNQPTPSTNQSQAINIQNGSGDHIVSRNRMVGCAIYSGSANGTFTDNIISGWLFGSGITLGTPPTDVGSYNRCIGNYVLNGGGNPDVNNTYGYGIECWSSYTLISGNTCIGCSGAGISVGAPYCIVTGNQCLNNSQSLQPQSGIIIYGKLVSGVPFTASNGIITHNQLGDNQGSPTQQYGYAEYQNIAGSAPITGMIRVGNSTFNNVVAAYLLASTSPGSVEITAPTTTSAPGSGGAGALPANPAGYATIPVNGTSRQVAFY
jgi:Pectate lyase superfamily protein